MHRLPPQTVKGIAAKAARTARRAAGRAQAGWPPGPSRSAASHAAGSRSHRAGAALVAASGLVLEPVEEFDLARPRRAFGMDRGHRQHDLPGALLCAHGRLVAKTIEGKTAVGNTVFLSERNQRLNDPTQLFCLR